MAYYPSKTTDTLSVELGAKMKLTDVVQINAPIEVVWRVTTDIEQWSRWTPTIDSIQRLDSGKFDVGSRAHVKQPGMPVTEWTVIEMIDQHRFTWRSRGFGLTMTASHELKTSPHGTENVLRLAMEYGANRVIFASSIAALQPPPTGERLTEKTVATGYIPYA